MNLQHINRADRAVILPHYGEFGWQVMHHMRYVHAMPARSKIVCIERGHECLYPSATSFFYDWTPPFQDHQKWNGMTHAETDRLLSDKCRERFGDHVAVRPEYDDHHRMADRVKFRPQAVATLPMVDIAIGARYRNFVLEKNWDHWGRTITALRSLGLKVGMVGAKDTSYWALPADAYAWDHPDGETAGTVDLLGRCTLFVSSDTGVAHLAALMDVPSLIFRKALDGNPDQTDVMRRANRVYHRRLRDEAWDNPDEVLGGIVRCYAERVQCHKTT